MLKVGTADTFRLRLEQVITRSGQNHSAFARDAGMDRSTLSQLLSADNHRLPRAETLVAVASHCRVSVDWLLGLSEREQVGAEFVETVMQFAPQSHAPTDDRWFQWLAEAGGHRVRTVPVSFPDFLKTEDVLRFEYADSRQIEPERSIEAAHARLAVLRTPEIEIEACVALQSLVCFARAQAQWEGITPGMRQAQLNYLAERVEELYPGFRLFLYDERHTYSVPFTVFGLKRATVYLGSSFLVFNAGEQIRMMSRRFDDLIRAASVQPNAVAAFVRGLMEGEAG